MAIFDFTRLAAALSEIAAQLKRLADQGETPVETREVVQAKVLRTDRERIAVRQQVFEQAVNSGLSKEQARTKVRQLSARKQIHP